MQNKPKKKKNLRAFSVAVHKRHALRSRTLGQIKEHNYLTNKIYPLWISSAFFAFCYFEEGDCLICRLAPLSPYIASRIVLRSINQDELPVIDTDRATRIGQYSISYTAWDVFTCAESCKGHFGVRTALHGQRDP